MKTVVETINHELVICSTQEVLGVDGSSLVICGASGTMEQQLKVKIPDL
jgi:23S rRNA A2030 N6-methylase RlmJ